MNKMPINKKRVQINFSAAAPHYDQISSLQSEISRQLLSFFTVRQATRIMDIGTGTGRLLWSLTKFFPSSELHGCDLAYGMISQASHRAPKKITLSPTSISSPIFLQADAEKLPYRSSTFDLVLSNSAYQWVPNINEAFQEVYRMLKPEGEFCFSIFGEGTLAELHFSFQQAYQRLKINTLKTRAHPFLSPQNLKESLTNQGFSKIILKELVIYRNYPAVQSLFSELKAMGSSNVTLDRSAGLGGRKILKEMIKCYEKNFRNEKGLIATYRIILMRAEKK